MDEPQPARAVEEVRSKYWSSDETPRVWRRSSVTKRPILRDEDGAEALKKRTLTNLSNARPPWLAMRTTPLTQRWLPRTVGRSTSPTTDALRELLALNGGDVCTSLRQPRVPSVKSRPRRTEPGDALG